MIPAGFPTSATPIAGADYRIITVRFKTVFPQTSVGCTKVKRGLRAIRCGRREFLTTLPESSGNLLRLDELPPFRPRNSGSTVSLPRVSPGEEVHPVHSLHLGDLEAMSTPVQPGINSSRQARQIRNG